MSKLPLPVRIRLWAARGALHEAAAFYRGLVALATSAGRTLDIEVDTQVRVNLDQMPDKPVPAPAGWSKTGGE